MLLGDLAEEAVEVTVRRDHAHVGWDRLGEDGSDLVAALREKRLHGRAIVVREHDGVLDGSLGDARRVREPEGGDTGSRLHEQRIDVAVVAARELHDQVAPGGGTGQPDSRHHRLGTGRHEAHALDRADARDDLLCQQRLSHRGCTEGRGMTHDVA